MSIVDAELRRLAQRKVDEPIIAMAQFRVTAPPLLLGPGIGVVVGAIWMALDWSYRRRHAHLPIPAYLAVTNTSVFVFSARFGGRTKLVGPTQRWSRSEISAERSADSNLQVLLQWGAGKPIIEIEAADPGPESAQVVRLLCGEREPPKAAQAP